MSNLALLFACLLLGTLLRASSKLPGNAPATINGFITNIAPALVLTYGIAGLAILQLFRACALALDLPRAVARLPRFPESTRARGQITREREFRSPAN